MSHPIHLILSSGTRIVTRNDANRIRGQAAHEQSQLPEAPSDETRKMLNDLLVRVRLKTGAAIPTFRVSSDAPTVPSDRAGRFLSSEDSGS